MPLENIKLAVVGLGLMGGSLAKALKNCSYEIWGLDTDISRVDLALREGYITHSDYNVEEAFKWADIIILCILPTVAIEIIGKYKKLITGNKILSDFCGIKRVILKQCNDITYVGIHTMAGREKGGYENSSESLFANSNVIITPNSISTDFDIRKIETLVRDIGCENITIASADIHDKMIAFTSELMHIAACSIVNHDDFISSIGFEGNSLYDHTRVGTIDADMWSELFYLNSDYLYDALSKYIKCLEDFRISLKDREAVRELLKLSNSKKEIWLNERND